MSNSNQPHPAGIIAACPTPFKDDLTVDHELLADHCKWLLANGCTGIAPLGSTGEASSFSVMERIEILEKLVIAGVPCGRIIVGTGCCAVPDTVLLIKHALSVGVTTVLVLPPFYYKNVTEDGLFDAYDRIIATVADGRLKMLLYHNPKVSGIPIQRGLIERLLRSHADTVVGMKDSGGDWDHMKGNRELFPGMRIYSGSETFMLNNLTAGGAGCISATFNITCSVAADLLSKRHTDKAADVQKILSQIRRVIEGYPLVAAVKYTLAEISNNPRWKNVRPPLTVLSAKDASELQEAIKNLDFDPGGG